ncbi:MAG TPA: antibiotic biosynthesis monooxygenase [Mycobacteriales bacterium]|nr:antibiotic biosynthesis monooxygenase [Mycobacteriales bacterium]
MATAFVRHRVADYATWRQVYDDFAAVQAASGVVSRAVFRGREDPNELLVMHRFRTLSEAEAFVESVALREAMDAAGVRGTAQVELYDEAD